MSLMDMSYEKDRNIRKYMKELKEATTKEDKQRARASLNHWLDIGWKTKEAHYK